MLQYLQREVNIITVEKNKQLISEDFDQRLSEIVGIVDCGQYKHSGDEIIIELEKNRVEIAKNGIVMLYQTYILTPDKNHSFLFQAINPDPKLSALAFEIIVRYFNLGVLNVTLEKIVSIKNDYEKRISTDPANYDTNTRMSRKARHYSVRIEQLISETNENLSFLLEGQAPIFRADDENMIYKKII